MDIIGYAVGLALNPKLTHKQKIKLLLEEAKKQ